MILTQYLQRNCIKVPLAGKNKLEAITELVGILNGGNLLSNKDMAIKAVLAREHLKSTGIGLGVAIPHAKCRAVKDTVMAIGITDYAIDFGSVDGKPVSIIALLVSPLEHTIQHLKALGGINRLMLDETLRNEMQKAGSAENVWRLLCRSHQNLLTNDKSVIFPPKNYTNVDYISRAV